MVALTTLNLCAVYGHGRKYSKEASRQMDKDMPDTDKDAAFNKEDMLRAAELCVECTTLERGELWIPEFAGCAECKGYVFAQTSEVQQQLGACGCVVALEMELNDRIDRLNSGFTATSLSDLSEGIALSVDVANELVALLVEQALSAQVAALDDVPLKKRSKGVSKHSMRQEVSYLHNARQHSSKDSRRGVIVRASALRSGRARR